MSKAKVSPAVAAIDNKIAHIRGRIEDLQAQLEDLYVQREKLVSIDSLKVGAEVIYRPGRNPKDVHKARVIFIQDEGSKGTWYTLRLNEGTADETTKKVRLSEITLK